MAVISYVCEHEKGTVHPITCHKGTEGEYL